MATTFATRQSLVAGLTVYAAFRRDGADLGTAPMAEDAGTAGTPGKIDRTFRGSVPPSITPGDLLAVAYWQVGDAPDPTADWPIAYLPIAVAADLAPFSPGRRNPHDRHMVDRVGVQANTRAGKSQWSGPAESWATIAADAPCLVALDREAMDAQADPGRNAPEDVRRYRVSFTNPPAALGRNHRLAWDAGEPIGTRYLYVVMPLVRDPTGRLWICGAEDRGQVPG